MRPTPRVLLGKRLLWTEKRDGKNTTIWVGDDNQIKISSHYQEKAVDDIRQLVERAEDYPKIVKLLRENPHYQVYCEACPKGRSITGAEVYDRDVLFVFDIYDSRAQKFLPYVVVHQHCYHHQIPIVSLFADTRHRSMKDLLKFKNYVLKECKSKGLEGMVIKPKNPYIELFGHPQYIQAKVKLDVPEPKKRKIQRGEPIYPPIPPNEILGAIDKVFQELGKEEFSNVSVAMPLVAKAVAIECKKHFYSKSDQKLFKFYQEYLERMIT